MDKQYQKMRKKADLVGSICGGLLIGLPAIAWQTPSGYAMPRMEADKPLSQVNPNSTDSNEVPSNSGTSNSPLNPRPSIFDEAPYNRSPGTLPTTPLPSPTTRPAPGSTIQPPLPENQEAPSAVVMPKDGKINIKLMNATNAIITYQVIGDTAPRPLAGDSDVTLQNIETPVTLTFVREDGGLLMVSPQAAAEGVLQVTLDESKEFTDDKGTIVVQEDGQVFIN